LEFPLQRVFRLKAIHLQYLRLKPGLQPFDLYSESLADRGRDEGWNLTPPSEPDVRISPDTSGLSGR